MMKRQYMILGERIISKASPLEKYDFNKEVAVSTINS